MLKKSFFLGAALAMAIASPALSFQETQSIDRDNGYRRDYRNATGVVLGECLRREVRNDLANFSYGTSGRTNMCVEYVVKKGKGNVKTGDILVRPKKRPLFGN